MPQLIAPTVEVRASFIEAMKEFIAEGRGTPHDHSSVGQELREFADRWHDPAVFAGYVASLRAASLEATPRRAGFVPCTTLWYVEGTTYLGRLAIRHRLNGFLRDYGGHIGYDVRAGARRRGHATAMLREALPHVNRLGIDPVLVTCDDDNTGSRKVIEAGGGVLEDRRGDKLRYWIPTTPSSTGTG